MDGLACSCQPYGLSHYVLRARAKYNRFGSSGPMQTTWKTYLIVLSSKFGQLLPVARMSQRFHNPRAKFRSLAAAAIARVAVGRIPARSTGPARIDAQCSSNACAGGDSGFLFPCRWGLWLWQFGEIEIPTIPIVNDSPHNRYGH
jgi:hypothetical protein